MSNWICDKCGATYIDVSHQEPSVLKQEIEIRKLKQLLVECRNWLKSYRDTHSSIKDDVNETICKIDEVLK